MTLKWILPLILLFQAPRMAIVECTADTSIPGHHGRDEVLTLGSGSTVLLAFRMGAVDGWTVDQAVLLLHPAGGKTAPLQIAPIQSIWSEAADSLPRLGDFQSVQGNPKADGWVAVGVPPSFFGEGFRGIALRATSGQIHARESSQFSPYLAVKKKM